MIYACNDEGIAALRQGQSNIETAIEEVKTKSNELSETISSYNMIGPHKDKIIKVLEEISDVIIGATQPAALAAEKLGNLADDYAEFKEEDNYSSSKN